MPSTCLRRRDLLAATLTLATGAAWADADADAEVEGLLREGGVVMAFRHALAPGTFDPPQFKLSDCSTQRNLSDAGRAQARRIGAWFSARSLRPAQVRASPWCRCTDTARLAFGRVTPWAALASPVIGSDAQNQAALQQVRSAVAAAEPGAFDVWVTHMFVLSALVGGAAASGDGLLLRVGADGVPTVLAQLKMA